MCSAQVGIRSYWLRMSGVRYHRVKESMDIPCLWCVGAYSYSHYLIEPL